MINKELKEQIQSAFQYCLDEAEGDNDREIKENAKSRLADNIYRFELLNIELSNRDLLRQHDDIVNYINMEL